MAHVDYEGAWVELGGRLLAKPGWGSKELHELMAEIAAKHSLPENFVQKIVRLYGGTIHLTITPEPGTAVPVESELTDESKPPEPEASTTRSHDERERHQGADRPDGSQRVPAAA